MEALLRGFDDTYLLPTSQGGQLFISPLLVRAFGASIRGAS